MPGRLYSEVHGGPTFDPVGRYSHVTVMYEKTDACFFSKVKANQKCSLPKADQNCFPKAKADQKRFSTRRHFFEEKLGLIKSVFSCISVM